MTTTQIVVDVMFAVSLLTFISNFVHGFVENKSYKTRLWVDIIAFIILFIVFMNVNQGN